MSFGKPFANQVINEINKARTNPRAMADKIRGHLNNFQGKILKINGIPNGLLVKEGLAVFEEAIDFLSGMPNLPKLNVDQDLNAAAQETAEQMGQVRDYGRIRSMNKESITSRFYNLVGKFGQSTDLGSLTPELVAMNLIIDDGDIQRKNRNMVFNEAYQTIGVGSAKNGTYKGVTVVIYAQDFTKQKLSASAGVRMGNGVKNTNGFQEEIDYQVGNNTMKDKEYRNNAGVGGAIKKNNVDNSTYVNPNAHGETVSGNTYKKKGGNNINVAQSYSGSNGFDPNNYDPRYIKDLTTELAILKSGVPYRYINGVNPKIDLLTDTAKYGTPKQIFEAVFGYQTK